MKIICIGRNYKDHAKEMNAAIPTEPVFFMKPDTALMKGGGDFYHPDFTEEIHYECELVVKIDKVGKNIAKEFAHKYYTEIGVGIDFTARDLQQECKEKSLPWEKAKAFDNSAPVSIEFIKKDTLDLNNISFSLAKHDKVVQQSTSSEMIFSIDEIIVYVSKFVTLKTGDLIFTGTPAGVGKIEIGDVLSAKIGNNTLLEVKVC